MPVARAYIVEDLRDSERNVVDMQAQGIIPDLDQAVDCKVLDVSENGAKIELIDADVLPATFKLYMPEQHCICECRVVRKVNRQLGLRIENRAFL